MKRRLIFGLVAVVLGLNLILGAAIYLNSARATDKRIRWTRTWIVRQCAAKGPRGICGRHESDLSAACLRRAIKGMIGTLDPHSEFLDAENYRQLQDDTEGQFGGLGIVITMKDNYVTVVAPMEDSPGFRAGILPATAS